MDIEEHMHLAVDEIREIAAKISDHYEENGSTMDARTCMTMAERQYILGNIHLLRSLKPATKKATKKVAKETK